MSTNFWFAVRLDGEEQITEVFDTFHKSSELGEVLVAIAHRFNLQVNQCILAHRGKILHDKSKVLLDCGINRCETVLLFKRREVDPSVDIAIPNPTEIEANLLMERPTSPNETNIDETTCAECHQMHPIDNENIFCEECHNWWHWACVEPPLTGLPEGDWFCADCANDVNVVIRPDNEARNVNQKKPKARKGDKWGRGVSNEGVSCKCTVPEDHRGHIPGISVGQSWKYRIYCAEDGVHRSPIAGITGTEKMGGAVSICMSGGYSTDEDHGEWFLYTGSGGFPTSQPGSSTSRTGLGQVRDQTLTKHNLALAVTCDTAVHLDRATARNWRNSKPIRVVRGYTSKGGYGPEEGYRYDGLYKIARYFRTAPLQNGFTRYIFEFRRDDETPAPWTEEGKAISLNLGLKMIRSSAVSRRLEQAPKSTNTQEELSESWVIPQSIRAAVAEAISATPSHEKMLTPLLSESFPGKYEFVNFLREHITCPICTDFVDHPVTNPCGHIACLECLKQCAMSDYGCRCTLCRASLLASTMTSGYGDSEWASNLAWQTFLELVEVDKNLVRILRLCLDTYCEDVEIDNPSRSQHAGSLIEYHGTTCDEAVPDVAQANNYTKIFAASLISENQDRKVLPSNEIGGYAPFDLQETVDKQLLEEANVSVRENKPMGFHEQQALHFEHHHPTISEAKINQYLRIKDAVQKKKRGFSEIDAGKENLTDFDTDEGLAKVLRRTRKKSTRGYQMDMSLGMFTTFDEYQ